MNVLITGGAKGLGKIISEHLMEKGNSVYVIDILEERDLSESFREKISGYYKLDLSDEKAVLSFIENIAIEKIKPQVIINNASLREFSSIEKFSDNQIERVFFVNTIVPVLFVRHLLPLMIEQKFGRIINISSASAFQGYSTGSLYCGSKSALAAFSESVAKDIRQIANGVTINTISPDSFMSREGVKVKDYEAIIGKIIKTIDVFIADDNINGRNVLVSGVLKKLVLLIHFLMKIK